MTASKLLAFEFIKMYQPLSKGNHVKSTKGFGKIKGSSLLMVSESRSCAVCTQVTASRLMVAKDGSTSTTGHQLELSYSD